MSHPGAVWRAGSAVAGEPASHFQGRGVAPALLDSQSVASVRHPVLIVDDDEASCRFMAEVLEQAGIAAEWTTDDGGATERVRRRRYALVVADVGMPAVPGPAIVAEVERATPGLPTLLVSAFADAGARAEATRLGVPILAKPFKAETFLATVSALVGDDDLSTDPAHVVFART